MERERRKKMKDDLQKVFAATPDASIKLSVRTALDLVISLDNAELELAKYRLRDFAKNPFEDIFKTK